MECSELRELLAQLALALDIPPDTPLMAERLLDRIGNIRHQAQHAQVLSHCLEKNRVLHAQNAELQASLHKLAQAPDPGGQAHPLFHIFNICIRRARQDEEAGANLPQQAFWRQTWVELAENYGSGFLYAQAMQKLREAQNGLSSDSAGRKRVDAINLIAMGLLHERCQRPRPGDTDVHVEES